MLPNLGWGELVIIFVVVLLLFGAKRLPEIGKAIGQAIKSFKKGLHEDDDKNK
jgi:sec-independent protein translocase protein TatA